MVNLDKFQRSAAYALPNKSILVKAPPGAGKTLVMAKRIEFLIRINAIKKPFKILGLTFSNAAADEMRKRVTKEVPAAKGLVHITNFHSFAYSILKAYGNCIDIQRNFSIISEFNSEKIMKEKLGILKFYGLSKYNSKRKRAEALFYSYKNWKTERILKLNDFEDKSYDEKFEKTLIEFRKELKLLNCLDFDHILYYAYKLLKNNPSVLSYYKSVFKYILVDEFQDTNPLQFKLLEILAEKNDLNQFNTPVFILSDPNQGIYEFQGADTRNIDQALKSFNCDIIKLNGEYRFNSQGIKILKDAISIFIENKKLLLSPLPKNRPIYSCWNRKIDEAKYLIEKIEELKKEKIKLHEIAILSPMGANLEKLREGLKSEEYIFIPDFKGSEIEKKYLILFDELNDISNSKGNLEETIKIACENNGIDINDDIISILIEIAQTFDKRYSGDLTEKIGLFINEILLEINWGELLRRKIKNKLFLSTIHSAKGLEFERVFVCGLESGSLPFFPICNKCHGNLDESEWIQSLKILNVGVSRAKDQLYLSSSNKNNWNYDTHSSCVLNPFKYYFDNL